MDVESARAGALAREFPDCARLIKALNECNRKHSSHIERGIVCRQLNFSVAECLLKIVCGPELDRVNSLCSSQGTKAKKRQCSDAKLALEDCIQRNQEAR
jgi:hypothetical protein